MMVERYLNLKEDVGGSIPGCKISYLLDIKFAQWSIASCALASPCRSSVSQIKIEYEHLHLSGLWLDMDLKMNTKKTLL
jgi:hypothetical protein